LGATKVVRLARHVPSIGPVEWPALLEHPPWASPSRWRSMLLLHCRRKGGVIGIPDLAI
jgi:hypothetical protein